MNDIECKKLNDIEYRKLASIVFPMLEHLLSNLYTIIQKLDNTTYDSRITREEVKKGKKTITKISVVQLTPEQVYIYLKEKGYIPAIETTMPILEQLTKNAWTITQVSDFIHSQSEELQENIWLLYKFDNCNFDNQSRDTIHLKLDACNYAIQHCYQFMTGDKIMDKINSIFGYVAMQIKKNFECILFSEENLPF